MRVICLDMPGFGFTAPAADFGFTLGEFARVVEEVLTELGCERSVLSFPCFTAYVALTLAQQRPELVERLILPQAPDWQSELRWFTATSALGALKTPVLGQMFMTRLQRHAPRAWLYPWFSLTVPAGPDRASIRATTLASVDAGMINCWASVYQAWHACPVPNFEHVEQPCLAPWGSRDRTHLMTQGSSILSCVPSAQTETYEASGHYCYLQEPERFASQVLRSL